MAGQHQTWLMVVLSCVVVASNHASTLGGWMPRLELLNTGVPGQSLQGAWSWQTPEGSSVLIQYPVNSQGFIPWPTNEYSYSISSYPAKKVFPEVKNEVDWVSQFDERISLLPSNRPQPQLIGAASNQQQTLRISRKIESHIPNNNYHSSTSVHDIPIENMNETITEIDTSETPLITEPIDLALYYTTTEKIPVTVTEKPIHTTSGIPQFTQARTTSYPRRYTPMTEAPKYIEIPTESPVEIHTVQSIEDALTTTIPIEESDIETDDIRGHFVDPSDKEVIPATESILENNVYNEIDNINYIEETGEQIDDTTELGPVVRLTSRGRPQLHPNSHPVPKLIRNPAHRQINTRQPAFRVNAENRSRPRRPELRNRLTSRGRPYTLNNTPQKEKSEIRKQSISQKTDNHPVPQLIINPSLRQINTRRPTYRRPQPQ